VWNVSLKIVTIQASLNDKSQESFGLRPDNRDLTTEHYISTLLSAAKSARNIKAIRYNTRGLF